MVPLSEASNVEDLMEAIWPDGYKAKLDITVGEYKTNATLLADTAKCKSATLWTAEDPHTKDAWLRIAPKKDRTPLICLYRKVPDEDEKMICSLRQIWLTAENPREKAIEIMKLVADSYMKTEVPLECLHSERDKLLQKHGVVLNTAAGAPAAAKSKVVEKKAAKSKAIGGSEASGDKKVEAKPAAKSKASDGSEAIGGIEASGDKIVVAKKAAKSKASGSSEASGSKKDEAKPAAKSKASGGSEASCDKRKADKLTNIETPGQGKQNLTMEGAKLTKIETQGNQDLTRKEAAEITKSSSSLRSESSDDDMAPPVVR